MSALIYQRDLQSTIDGKYLHILQRLPAGARVLEIGCSTGYFSQLLMQKGYRVFGIERDPEAVSVAQAKGLEVACANVEDANLSLPGSFDVILLMDVLEHLQHPDDLLLRLKRYLNQDGRLLVTGPNVAFWGVRKNLLMGRWDYADVGILDRTHLRFYTHSTWRALLEGAGYKITYFAPSEYMIPFENTFRKLGAGTFEKLRQTAIKWFPNLFTIVFIIEATQPRDES
jgi:2-polyprenyl-3-methyl-5-hydroxy-6-metoxy-1,4-benzoquinol methylase